MNLRTRVDSNSYIIRIKWLEVELTQEGPERQQKVKVEHATSILNKNRIKIT